MRRVPIMFVAFATLASAQERPTPQSQRDLTPPRDTVSAALPTIDLPEYVITGLASIDLPRVEKRLEELSATGDVIVSPGMPVRDRATGPLPGADGNRPVIGSMSSLNGYLRAGIGSYRTPQVMLSLRPSLESVALGINGRYARSSGFAPWTAWSEGGLDLSALVPLDLASAGFQHTRLSGDFGYDARSYHWYGTPTPSQRRAIATTDGGFGVRGFLGTWNGGLSLRFTSLSVDDSSHSVSETTTHVAAGAEGEVGEIPIAASLSIEASSRSLSTASPAGVTMVGLESRWMPMPTVRVSGGAAFGYLQGDGSQRRGVLLPTVRIQFAIDERHRLLGAFEPRVESITLVSSLSKHRFITAQTPLRQTYWSNAGRFGLESDWTTELRSRVELEAGKASDLAMVVDTVSAGVAAWRYGDASFASLRAECIAKMRGNDYFSATVVVRSSRNAASGLSIPYWPTFEARISYTAMVTPLLTVRSSLQYVHTRESQWSGTSVKLPKYAVIDASASYVIMPSMSVWTELTNVSNSVYQHWKGIQEPPFRLSAGIALAW